MPLRESGTVERGRAFALPLIAAAIVLLILGFLLLRVCGSGVSLIAFGAAVGLMGGVLALMGGHVILLPTAIVVVTLIWAGLVFASEAGCAL